MNQRTIFILSKTICILFLIGRVSYAQQFRAVLDSSIYPNISSGSSVNLGSDQAILYFKVRPVSFNSNTAEVLDASILPSFTRVTGVSVSGLGWSFSDTANDVRSFYSIVTSDTFYARTDQAYPNLQYLLPQVQNILVSKNLGTIDQRRFLIQTFNGSFVSPYDFRDYLKSWIVIGMTIAIALPAWFLFRRFLRG